MAVLLIGLGCLGGPFTEPPENVTGTGITKKMCTDAGGSWNDCGSSCRGGPVDAVCTAVCVPYCECGGIAGFKCPAGCVCGDYLPKGAADAMGICKKVSE